MYCFRTKSILLLYNYCRRLRNYYGHTIHVLGVLDVVVVVGLVGGQTANRRDASFAVRDSFGTGTLAVELRCQG